MQPVATRNSHGGAFLSGFSSASGHPRSELDELVLHLKGLVLARRYRERTGADTEELDMYEDEIENARSELAAFVLANRVEGNEPPLAGFQVL